MKLGKIITLGLLGGAGYVAYRIYQNREQIHEQIISTEDTVDAIATDLENIKKNLTYLAEQRETLQQLGQNLTYKTRIFSQEAQAHLLQINQTLSKYQTEND